MPNNKFPIRYHISIESIPGHIFAVQLEVDSPAPQGQILRLPNWIPGSYMIRDFAKNVITFSVFDANNSRLPYQKLDKNSWKIAPHSGAITIKYTIYAFDFSVRHAYLDNSCGFLNGTSVFLAVDGQTDSHCSVEIEKPTISICNDWKVATTLPLSASTKLNQFGNYQAENYAELIDHPILLADYQSEVFSADNIDFELILVGAHQQTDKQRIAKDLTKLCQHHIQLFGEAPAIERYLFITLLSSDGFGGLEHSSSTALLYSRDDLPFIHQQDHMPDGYRKFLSLCSHEFFHTWHVKRIRPVELSDGRLDSEAYTEQLWIYEGFTSYYDDLSLVRSQLIEPSSYLEIVGQNLTKLHRNPGRFKQSVTESSFDAWTKFYQQDASAINNIVNYYNKGAILALCLDLLIRDRSQQKFTLDDIMVQLWQQYGKLSSPTSRHVVQQIIQQQLGLDLNDFLEAALYSTAELPVAQLLKTVGLEIKLRPRNGTSDIGGKPSEKNQYRSFGAAYKSADTGVKITQITEKSPAYNAGLQVGDQLIALDNWQIQGDKLLNLLDRYSVGQTVTLHVLRNGQLDILEMLIEAAPLDTIYLEITHKEKVEPWLTMTI